MAQANPGQTLTSATAAGAGTAIDFTGVATAGVGSVILPKQVHAIINVGTFTATAPSDTSAVAEPAEMIIGLEVSHDSSAWVRVSKTRVSEVGVISLQATAPCRYARCTIDALSSLISGISVTAYVAGS